MGNGLYFLALTANDGSLWDGSPLVGEYCEVLSKFRGLNITLRNKNQVEGMLELAVSAQFFHFVCENLTLGRNKVVTPTHRTVGAFVERHVFLGFEEFDGILGAWEDSLNKELELLKGRVDSLMGEGVLVRQLRAFFPKPSLG